MRCAAGITENFRSRQHDDVIVGVSGYGRRVGRFEGLSHILAEIHAEVGEIFENDDIVFCCQFADNFQFAFFQTYPCRIIGIGIDNGSDMAFFEKRFQLVPQVVSPEMIDVELFPLHS